MTFRKVVNPWLLFRRPPPTVAFVAYRDHQAVYLSRPLPVDASTVLIVTSDAGFAGVPARRLSPGDAKSRRLDCCDSAQA